MNYTSTSVSDAMEGGYNFHTDPEGEPAVSIPLVAAVADWIVEVDELISPDTGQYGGTKTVLCNGQYEIHITQIDNKVAVAQLFDQDDGDAFVENGQFTSRLGEPIATSENPAEIIGWILKYAPGTGPKFPTTQQDAEVIPIDS